MAEAAILNCDGIDDKPETLRKTIKRDAFTNVINYLNFADELLKVVFRHRVFKRELTIEAVPSPCQDEKVELRWKNHDNDDALEQFDCIKMIIPEQEGVIAITPVRYELHEQGMTAELPETAELINCRKNIRHQAGNVEISLIHGGSIFSGRLIDFTPETLLVDLAGNDNSELRWINRDDLFSIILKAGGEVVFTGTCILIASRSSESTDCHAFRIINSQIRKFRKKKFRGDRFEMMSPVNISFVHPLSGERCRVPVIDLSACGLSLLEDEFHSHLIPGLQLPEIELILPGGTPLSCSAQVIYREKIEESGKTAVKCGAAILDMDPGHHALLLNFIHGESDYHSSVCSRVDMNALWKFFFESGFIYPSKYRQLSEKKENIKDLYERLYTGNPGIARHFIYQEGGRILGHMSMLRSYENSWLMHHHAATTFGGRNAGLQVLNQAGSFANNSYRLQSLHMLYLICYFREENRFPRRVFGDIARNTGNPSEISLDSFSYFQFAKNDHNAGPLPDGWTISPTSGGDLKNLESFYRAHSDGLMLKAMSLSGGECSNNNIISDYEDAGFDRKIELSSLNLNGECRAIIMADKSEAGINMSSLTDSLKVFVINRENLTGGIISGFIRRAAGIFNDESVPVLMFPDTAADNLDIPVEKNYTLWILNTEASDSYFRHLKTLLKRINC